MANTYVTIRRLAALQLGNECARCHTKKGPFDFDHIKPVCEGGSETSLKNMQLLCERCHGEKCKEDIHRRHKKRFGW
jgi:5-methylcytosine-specific restriction endonuclease McrA